MAGPYLLRFDEMPQLRRSYPRVLLQRKPTLVAAGRSVPRIEAQLGAHVADADQLRGYRTLCGFADRGTLPLPLPHVLATPLHLEILTHPRFPISVLGLVHLRNSITQHRRIRAGETLDLRCALEGHRETARGQEFELWTYARAGDALVWEECCTFLARAERRGRGAREPAVRGDAAAGAGVKISDFEAPDDVGRDYARLSGDYNPIHLSALTARAFGFPRAIAHGMWTLARIAAEMEPAWPQDGSRMTVEFKQPVLLPARIALAYRGVGAGLAFELRDAHNSRRLHLSGGVEPVRSL
jgi:acyl dehydratase